MQRSLLGGETTPSDTLPAAVAIRRQFQGEVPGSVPVAAQARTHHAQQPAVLGAASASFEHMVALAHDRLPSSSAAARLGQRAGERASTAPPPPPVHAPQATPASTLTQTCDGQGLRGYRRPPRLIVVGEYPGGMCAERVVALSPAWEPPACRAIPQPLMLGPWLAGGDPPFPRVVGRGARATLRPSP